MWTEFYDMYSGGNLKTKWETIFVEAPENEAVKILEERLGVDPYNTTCLCCGQDFYISTKEKPTPLDKASKPVLTLRAPDFAMPSD